MKSDVTARCKIVGIQNVYYANLITKSRIRFAEKIKGNKYYVTGYLKNCEPFVCYTDEKLNPVKDNAPKETQEEMKELLQKERIRIITGMYKSANGKA